MNKEVSYQYVAAGQRPLRNLRKYLASAGVVLRQNKPTTKRKVHKNVQK